MAVLLREVLPFIFLLVPGFFLFRVWRARRSRIADWRSETHALPEGGFVVELRRPGEHAQIVARIPADLPHDEFAERMAEAQSEADANAAVLNSRNRARRR